MKPQDIDRIAREEQEARNRAKASKTSKAQAEEEILLRKIGAVSDTPSRVIIREGKEGSELFVRPNPVFQTIVARGPFFVGLVYLGPLLAVIMVNLALMENKQGVPVFLGMVLPVLLLPVLDFIALWWMFPPVILRITQQGNFAILRKRIFRSSQKPDFIGAKSKLMVYLTNERDHRTLVRVPGWWEFNIKPGVKPQITPSGFVYRFTDWVMTPDRNNEYQAPLYPYLLKPADAQQVRDTTVLDFIALWWMFPQVILRITQQGNFAILRKRIFRSSQKPDFIGAKSKLMVYLTNERDHRTLVRVPGWWEFNIKPGVKPQITPSGFVYRFTDWVMTPDRNNEYQAPLYPYLLKPADAQQVRGFCEERGIRVKSR